MFCDFLTVVLEWIWFDQIKLNCGESSRVSWGVLGYLGVSWGVLGKFELSREFIILFLSCVNFLHFLLSMCYYLSWLFLLSQLHYLFV